MTLWLCRPSRITRYLGRPQAGIQFGTLCFEASYGPLAVRHSVDLTGLDRSTGERLTRTADFPLLLAGWGQVGESALHSLHPAVTLILATDDRKDYRLSASPEYVGGLLGRDRQSVDPGSALRFARDDVKRQGGAAVTESLRVPGSFLVIPLCGGA